MVKHELLIETYKGVYYIAMVKYKRKRFLFYYGGWHEEERKYLEPKNLYSNHYEYRISDEVVELTLWHYRKISLNFVEAKDATSYDVDECYFKTMEDAINTIAIMENLIGYEIPEVVGRYNLLFVNE